MANTWLPMTRFPLEKDLSPLLKLFQQQNIPAHVTEENGEQQLWIMEGFEDLAITTADQWFSGKAAPAPDVKNKSTKISSTQALQIIKILPVTVLLLVLGLLGTLLTALNVFDFFLFQSPFTRNGLSIADGDYWRLVTPTFLHFGPVHYIFNGLFIWAAGQRIELAKGSLHYLGLVMLIAIVSNVAQFISEPQIPFGGLSGVVYGILGYIAVYQRFIKDPVLNFQESMIIFAFVSLLLGVLGIFDLFMQGGIANAAHIGGLLMGVVLGFIAVAFSKK